VKGEERGRGNNEESSFIYLPGYRGDMKIGQSLCFSLTEFFEIVIKLG
jgi:hypothetical protein